LPILGHVDIDIKVREDGDMVVEISMPPGSHNGGFKEIVGLDDSEVVLDWVNENILNDPAISSAMDMNKVHVELHEADQFSSPIQELIDSAEMRPEEAFFVPQKAKAPAVKNEAPVGPPPTEEEPEEAPSLFTPAPKVKSGL